MDVKMHNYQLDDQEFNGYISLPSDRSGPKPAVLVFHDWGGCNDFARKKAAVLASLGYVGFAVDMYGNGRQGSTTEEKMALMMPLMENRTWLMHRAEAALNTLIALPEVDGRKIAAIGFCFGGLCALDLARSGVDGLLGVVSFHGLLQAPDGKTTFKSNSKILALHGYEDPMVTPDGVRDFCNEMKNAGVDWQMHMYGNTQHAFSNPEANDVAQGIVYNPIAEHRALQAMTNFLQSIF